MKTKVRQAITDALQKIAELKELPYFVVETPPEDKFGDFSTNVAMTLAKPLRQAPRKIAESMLPSLKENQLFTDVSIAGPGFINFFIKPGAWVDKFRSIPDDSSDYGSSPKKKDGKYLIEFVSANPTGPLHVGHGRGAAYGDALGRVLKKAGYDVTREYYVNDAGNQMQNLGRSTLARYREALDQKIDFPEDGYKGDYIKDIAKGIAKSDGDIYLDKPEEETIPHFTHETAKLILDGIKNDLKLFRVSFDNWVSEKTLHDSGAVERILAELEKSGEIFKEEGALWLKTEGAGDEKNRVVKRSNGLTTYLAADIAYHKDKYSRGYTNLIDIWGADHHGYVARIKAAVTALGKNPDSFSPQLVQIVNLKKDGKAVAMSTRGGTFVTLKEVIDEVGVDAARFIFLTRSHESHLDFDLDLAKKQSNENPVYYVQYGHARISNIFRTAAERGIKEVPQEVEWERLKRDEEIKIMKKSLAFPELVADCALGFAPHHITHYLGELAAMFHRYYYSNRIVTDDEELSKARLAFVARIRTVLKNGLELLGVNAPDKM